jgi:tRNA modification GTPase
VRQLTPSGVAGIAVVRLDSPDELHALGLRAADAVPGTVHLRRVRIGGEPIDEALVVTRVDHTVELHLHGAPALLAQLARAFRLTRSSPILAAEALLRAAMSVPQLELALEQLGLDRVAAVAELHTLPASVRGAALAAARERSRRARCLVEPQTVVLVGAANAGKSTLFNALLARDRALTGDLPGLTRDVVRERTTLSGYPYELVDTPGVMPQRGALDTAAWGLAQAALAPGGLVVHVVDAARPASAAAWTGAAALVVASKVDLSVGQAPAGLHFDLAVSCQRDPPSVVREQFGDLLRRHRGLPVAGAVGGPAALDAAEWAAFGLGPAVEA